MAMMGLALLYLVFCLINTTSGIGVTSPFGLASPRLEEAKRGLRASEEFGFRGLGV